MAHMDHLPIWRDANRLLVVIEEAVRRFPRYRKYTPGTDLRRQAMGICVSGSGNCGWRMVLSPKRVISRRA